MMKKIYCIFAVAVFLSLFASCAPETDASVSDTDTSTAVSDNGTESGKDTQNDKDFGWTKDYI